jgi:uncharacterized protein (DUF488 family)
VRQDVNKRLWTVGHSTRAIEEFLGLLQVHNIKVLVDVRAIPFSRRNPQFNQPDLQARLDTVSIVYKPLPGLGGRRKSEGSNLNAGWRNASFRAYADYMQTNAFQQALQALVDLAQSQATAIMCAEAVPWRCHRSLIADALIAQGWTVLDIIGSGEPQSHQLPAWARTENGRVTYPAQNAT